MSQRAILAIDEGTTNAKAILVSHEGEIIARGSAPVLIEHPQSGWVQQDADRIWQATQDAIAACIAEAPDSEIVALGISNQRESVMIWDRQTGRPLGPVITWQCRRTAEACNALKDAGREAEVVSRTGLPLDPLFPPTKIAWLLQNQEKDEANICIGTIDSWLIWKLSGRRVHATDRSNAARTQLFNLAESCWDGHLCELFGIELSMLPEVQDSSHIFARTKNVHSVADGVPIAAAIGDSHAALFGHGAFGSGDGKITFGTGSSVMTTLTEFIAPPPGITTTIAWSLGGETTYAFEGNILSSASILPWTATLLGVADVESLLNLAQAVPHTNGVSLVPAHVGLGSPYWNSEARGLITGLSFGSEPAHIARAAAQSIALQVHDVFTIMKDAATGIGHLSVDGGPSKNTFLMQMVADYLDHSITPCQNAEVSALGASYLAGLAIGFWQDLEEISCLVRHGAEIRPALDAKARDDELDIWRKAIARTIVSV